MTLHGLYKDSIDRLTRAGVDSPAFDTRCLFEMILGTDCGKLRSNADREASTEEINKLSELIKRRAEGEPLQYLLGFWEFFGRSFKVGKGVLIPRDDTEVVLRCTLDYLSQVSEHHPPKILDLCSGSGILAVTLKCEFENSEVTAVELSEEALPYLHENARLNRADISIVQADIFKYHSLASDDYFDLIISNPPYIKSGELNLLQKEVLREPMLALDGGADGLDFYRHIVPCYTSKLRNGGMLAFELDCDEADAVKLLMSRHGYKNITIFDDLGSIHRAINGTLLK